MKAVLLRREKTVLPNGAILEMIVWRVPEPVVGSSHSYKYRLFFGRNGRRIVGFDNERGKGDHCHIDGVETPYGFISPEVLVEDFVAEVVRRLGP